MESKNTQDKTKPLEKAEAALKDELLDGVAGGGWLPLKSACQSCGADIKYGDKFCQVCLDRMADEDKKRKKVPYYTRT